MRERDFGRKKRGRADGTKGKEEGKEGIIMRGSAVAVENPLKEKAHQVKKRCFDVNKTDLKCLFSLGRTVLRMFFKVCMGKMIEIHFKVNLTHVHD